MSLLDWHERTRETPPPAPLDPATEPVAFRRYKGSELLPLDLPPGGGGPAWDDLFRPGAVPAAPLDRASVSALFHDSLAVSAWVGEGEDAFSLRVPPSAGNLHPTESYLLGAVPGLRSRPALFHYSPFDHGLEVRRELPQGVGTPLLVGLSAVPWRCAWKYGERAFRLCHLDAGHAAAAVAVAAAIQGWTAHLVEMADDDLASLLGIRGRDHDERPVCLLTLLPRPSASPAPLAGTPTRISRETGDLSGFDEAWEATVRRERPGGGVRARRIVRERRSRREMSRLREIPESLLRRLEPAGNPVLGLFPGGVSVRPFVEEEATVTLAADLAPVEERPWLYRRLHWEAGALGHLLYLEAEAAGLAATGLALFGDGGLPSPWQPLYRVAVGLRRTP